MRLLCQSLLGKDTGELVLPNALLMLFTVRMLRNQPLVPDSMDHAHASILLLFSAVLVWPELKDLLNFCGLWLSDCMCGNNRFVETAEVINGTW